jgi:hypothetical protein
MQQIFSAANLQEAVIHQLEVDRIFPDADGKIPEQLSLAS